MNLPRLLPDQLNLKETGEYISLRNGKDLEGRFIIDAGKMKRAKACNLEKACQILVDSFNNLALHGDGKIPNKIILTNFKN